MGRGEIRLADLVANVPLLDRGDRVLEDLFEAIKQYLSAAEAAEAMHVKVISHFTALSLLCEKLRADEGVSAPEISRANEYLRVMMVNFQLMKHIRVYSTPTSVRAYTKFFLAIFPVVFGPAFADMADQAKQLWVGECVRGQPVWQAVCVCGAPLTLCSLRVLCVLCLLRCRCGHGRDLLPRAGGAGQHPGLP